MSEPGTTRMLLSHNFELPEDTFAKFSREEFTEIFAQGLKQYPKVKCAQLSHPHWMVEILFPTEDFSPPQIGEICANSLLQKRPANGENNIPSRYVLILAGLKTTPPLNNSPEGLQTGEWGVDAVETLSAEAFLSSIGWEEKTAGKTIENVFKIQVTD